MEKSETILAKDFMNEGVRAVDKSTTVSEVAKIMEREGIGSVVVIDENKPVGIITERDFAVKVAAKAYPLEKNVTGIMSSPLYFVSPFQTLSEIVQLMAKQNVRKIPVIQDNLPIGIVTTTDLVRLFSTCTDEEMKKIYQQFFARIFPEVKN